MSEKIAEKPVEEKPKSRVIWESENKGHGRLRVVACGERLTPEKWLGTDAMGVEAWQFIQWGDWSQPLAEEYLKLLAKESE